jgi:hypothetical protein
MLYSGEDISRDLKQYWKYAGFMQPLYQLDCSINPYEITGVQESSSQLLRFDHTSVGFRVEGHIRQKSGHPFHVRLKLLAVQRLHTRFLPTDYERVIKPE